MRVNGNSRLFVCITLVVMSIAISGHTPSYSQNSDQLIDDYNNEQISEFGSNYIIRSTYNKNIDENKTQGTEVRRFIEDYTYGEDNQDNDELDLKGPRAGNEGISEEGDKENGESEGSAEKRETEKMPQDILDYIGPYEYKAIYKEGKWYVSWVDIDGNGNIYVKHQLFNRDGKLVGPVSILNACSDTDQVWIEELKSLPNGNIICFWQEKKIDGGYYYGDNWISLYDQSLHFQVMDNSGTIISLQELVVELDNARDIETDVIINSRAGTFMIYNVERYAADSVEDTFVARAYNYAGRKLGETVLDVDMYVAPQKTMKQLQNSNTAVIWRSRGTYSADYKVQVIDPFAKRVGECHNLGFARFVTYENNTIVFDDGRFAVFLPELAVSVDGSSDRFMAYLFDDEGNKLKEKEITDSRGSRILAMWLETLTYLPNGNIVFFWKEEKQSGLFNWDTSWRMRIINSDLEYITEDILLFEHFGRHRYSYSKVSSTHVFENGNFAVFKSEEGHGSDHPSRTKVILMDVYDQRGNLISKDFDLSRGSGSEAVINNLLVLPDDKLAVIWSKNTNNQLCAIQVFDNHGRPLADAVYVDSEQYGNTRDLCVNNLDYRVTEDGNIYLLWIGGFWRGKYLYFQAFDNNGKYLGQRHILGEGDDVSSVKETFIDSVEILSDGSLDIIWRQEDDVARQRRYRAQVDPANDSVKEGIRVPVISPFKNTPVNPINTRWIFPWQIYRRSSYRGGQGMAGPAVSRIQYNETSSGLSNKPVNTIVIPLSMDLTEDVLSADYEYHTIEESIRLSLNAVYVSRFNQGLIHEESLENIVKVLEKVSNRTETEELVLNASMLFMELQQVADDKDLKEFESIMNVIIGIDAFGNAEQREGLKYIRSALNLMLSDHTKVYVEYLSQTRKTYEYLSGILGIALNSEKLPEDFVHLAQINKYADLKIAVDLALEELEARDSASLNNKEKEALDLSRDILLPLKEKYFKKVRQIIADCLSNITEIMKTNEPIAVYEEGEGTNAFFLFEARTE